MSPTLLEKALTFLDDRLLPATSNAVERTHRRYREMQKSVYRVRTYHNLVGRLSLDLQRERSRTPRRAALCSLHKIRNWDPRTPTPVERNAPAPNPRSRSRLRR